MEAGIPNKRATASVRCATANAGHEKAPSDEGEGCNLVNAGSPALLPPLAVSRSELPSGLSAGANFATLLARHVDCLAGTGIAGRSGLTVGDFEMAEAR